MRTTPSGGHRRGFALGAPGLIPPRGRADRLPGELAAVTTGALLPATPFARAPGFTPLPGAFFLTLPLRGLAYLLLAELGKHSFFRTPETRCPATPPHNQPSAGPTRRPPHHGPPVPVSRGSMKGTPDCSSTECLTIEHQGPYRRGSVTTKLECDATRIAVRSAARLSAEE